MADDFTANPGSGGSKFAADDLGGSPILLIPRVKPSWGVDGVAVDASVAAPMPVQATLESGQMVVAGTVVTPKYAVIAESSSGDNEIVAAVSGKKIRVLAASFMANGTVNAKFRNGTTDISGLYYLVANTGGVLPFNPAGWFETSATAALNINLSAAIAVGGNVTYIEV